MPLLPTPILDYSDKDFAALRERLFNLIRSVFPEWTDDQVAGFGNLLVELFAQVGDVLGFYQDNQAKESRWSTAQLRKNIIALVKLIDYTPTAATAAIATETFTLAAALAGDVVLPTGTRVLTREITDPIAFRLLEDLTIPAGATSAEATVEHSEAQEDSFTSEGTANQRFLLSKSPYIDGSAIPVASNGTFTQVDNFLNSAADDLHFMVVVDQNDRATTIFGNGTNGAIPLGTIVTTYKTGGGIDGRLDEDTLVRLEGSHVDSFGTPARFTVTNPERTSGGNDRQSSASIKVHAPPSLRVLERSVAREDYEIVALKVPGVARALHLTSNESDAIGENQGVLFIVPTDGGTPSQALIDAVDAMFVAPVADEKTYPKTNTYQVTTQAPDYLDVDIYVIAYFSSGTTPAAGKAAIEDSLDEFFRIENDDGTPNELINFGFYFKNADGEPANELNWSDLFNVIRDTTGIRKIDPGSEGLLLGGVRDDVALGAFQFPRLGTLTVINGDTGLPV